MISILMPIYNGVEYFKESYTSIQQQTFTQWELLIGLNGHSENSSSKYQLEKLIKDHNKTKLFHYKFAGKSKTLNSLLIEAQYDWIALLDVDDIWLPQKLAQQYPLTKEYDVIGTFCQYFEGSTGKPKLPKGSLKPSLFLKNNPLINSSCLIQKNICSWDESMFLLEDYELWLRLVSEGYSFNNLPKTLTLHRIHKNSFFNNDMRQEAIKKNLIEKYKKIFQKKGIMTKKKTNLVEKFLSFLQLD